ncbi:quinoprotein relay system zinc metallohydrolase 1 [Polaromonas sp.]|uniref:quinoprotein relay system zinc metallohydrolase 1 n=1 Tax=Polaromonas sp. TaxID=1869339 RepID=UPI001A20C9B6|nr:quinoprotein relay system zinc metallohydrolase 1 [Burkholderiales bacterium]
MMRWRRVLAVAAVLAMSAWAQAQTAAGQPVKRAALDMARLDYALQPRQIAPGVWVFEGAVEDFSRSNGCNIINTGFIVTGEGVVVINTGPSRLYGEQQRRAIERVTQEPVVKVLNLNLHPDYFFGNQAWSGLPVQALAGSIAGMQAEGRNYAGNMYRLCGDWMQGTEPTPARAAVVPQVLQPGTHRLELIRLEGHTGDDLLLLDHSTGVVFAGGLVFAERVPTTPHADVKNWLRSLDALDRRLAGFPLAVLVPSHGPLYKDSRGIGQTRDWLLWVSSLLEDSARRGLDLSEVLQTPVPARFQAWAAQPAELHRTLAQWYPLYEQRALLGELPDKGFK